MIVNIKKWLNLKKPRVVSSKRYGIEQAMLSKHALKTIQTLQKSGYSAYVVGGAVRDGLLGFKFKDIDIATDANPESIRRLFKRRARIIGRRFPIVHIYPAQHKKNDRDSILEITTFRGEGKNNKTPYGSESEDAQRRDFTANALLYDPFEEKIIDHVGGLNDIKARQLIMIGVPKKRMQEDPIRLLRAIRLSEKIGLAIDKKIVNTFKSQAHLLADIPTARLFDEFIKVFNSGASARILKQWQTYDIVQYVLPALTDENPFFFSVAAENDRRYAEKREHSLTFLLAALFWQQTISHWEQFMKENKNGYIAMEQAIAETGFSDNKIIPNQIISRIKDIYFLQARMKMVFNQRGAESIINRQYFDRALAFATSRRDEGAAQAASWWAQYVQANAAEKKRMISLLPPRNKRKKKKA